MVGGDCGIVKLLVFVVVLEIHLESGLLSRRPVHPGHQIFSQKVILRGSRQTDFRVPKSQPASDPFTTVACPLPKKGVTLAKLWLGGSQPSP